MSPTVDARPLGQSPATPKSQLERTKLAELARGAALTRTGEMVLRHSDLLALLAEHDFPKKTEAAERPACTTMCHDLRVTLLAARLGETLGLDEEALDLLTEGAILHDAGKMIIPTRILQKNGPPDAAERAELDAHPWYSRRIAEMNGVSQAVGILAGLHHEFQRHAYPIDPALLQTPRADRRHRDAGPPDGALDRRHGASKRVVDDRLLRLAQILALADEWDALSSARPYKSALSPAAAAAIVRRDFTGDGELRERVLEILADGKIFAETQTDAARFAAVVLEAYEIDGTVPRSGASIGHTGPTEHAWLATNLPGIDGSLRVAMG